MLCFFQGDHFSEKPFGNSRELSGKEACEEKLSTYVQHSNGKVLKYKKMHHKGRCKK